MALTVLCGLLTGCAQQPRVAPAEGSAEVSSPAGVARWQQHLLDGDAAHRAGRMEDALLHYLLAEQIVSTLVERPLGMQGDEVLWRIALMHEAAQRWPEASETWALAARRADRRGENLQRLGWARLRLQQFTAAREAFSAALTHDASHIQARLGLALASEALGEWALAAQHLDEVLHLDPQQPTAQLARIRVALRQADLPAAKQGLRILLRQGAPQETYALLGDVLAREGDYAKALQAYVKHFPLHESWARLARQAMQQQDYARAIRYFEQAAKESPTHLEELHKQRAVAKEWQQSLLTPIP
jgi:tetratricopeptide (TPR) repeat protein